MWSVFGRKKPAQSGRTGTLWLARAGKCSARPSDARRALEFRQKLAAGGSMNSQPLHVPGIELPQIARPALCAEMLHRTIHHPVDLGEDLRPGRVAVGAVQELAKQPRIPQRSPREEHSRSAGALERRPRLLGGL